MKAQQKAEIKEVFGERMSTNLLINLIALFPKLLETVLELITVWKKHRATVKANKLMDGGDPVHGDPLKPDPE
ncbi:MAG: hypothetical protein WC810_26660 [Janthinobacterium sp.]|jgi:hypothetical protein